MSVTLFAGRIHTQIHLSPATVIQLTQRKNIQNSAAADATVNRNR